MSKIKVVHYINQFFAQIGGEEKADYPAELRVGEIVGPGQALTQQFGEEAEIIATIVCGDSYFNENLDKAKADILEMVKSQNPDIFIAGPAFNAGRYGVACGTICDAVQEELGIPAVTGMYVENPGADMFKNKVYTVSTKNSAAGMRDAVKKLAPLALKIAKGEKIGASCQEGYMPNGVRVNFFEKERGSKRAVKMLLKIIATIVCGDSYFNENLDKAKADILEMVKSQNPDIFIAGPAFNAGRYGVACGTICDAVQEELGIPAVTGMYVENPGADMFKNKVYTVSTKNSAAGMRDAVKKLAPLALKIAKGEKIGASCQEGYMPNGVRVNFFEKERGSKRAVKMLLKKLADKPFETEYPMPTFDRVDPQPAIKDLSKATIALCTSGGIVPKGNPDHIESSNASHYGEYDITGVMDLTEETYETAHGGYDPVYANEDPDRVLPVDVMREFEKEGVIGKLHNKFYTTVGNGTAVASAKAFAEEYAQKLIADGVDAVIMTST